MDEKYKAAKLRYINESRKEMEAIKNATKKVWQKEHWLWKEDGVSEANRVTSGVCFEEPYFDENGKLMKIEKRIPIRRKQEEEEDGEEGEL